MKHGFVRAGGAARGRQLFIASSFSPTRRYPAMNLIRSFAGAVLATAVLAITSPVQAQETTLRIESILPATHATSRAMEVFKAELARLSEGAIDVEVSAGAQRRLHAFAAPFAEFSMADRIRSGVSGKS
jgi:hypothetical protein